MKDVLTYTDYHQYIADYYAVATIDEAVELRNAGIDTPILILGYTDESDYIYALKYDVTLAIYDVENNIYLPLNFIDYIDDKKILVWNGLEKYEPLIKSKGFK